MEEILVAAGEASGDRAAASALAELPGVRSYGLGGSALQGLGTELVADLRRTTGMGITEVATSVPRLLYLLHALEREAIRRRTKVALLVNYSDFNVRLGHRLRKAGVKVLFYGPPQVWAWRSGRAAEVARSADVVATMLPFEAPLWRAFGVTAKYVGHPSLEHLPMPRDAARARLDLTDRAFAVGILPGSRREEVTRLLPAMLDGYVVARKEHATVDGRVFLAPSLDADTTRFLRREAKLRNVPVVAIDAREGALPMLSAFDATFCASGTASLEAAVANAVPVVAYKVSLVTELVGRALLSVDHVALPNLIVGRRAFCELLQRDVTPRKLYRALREVMRKREHYMDACAEVRARLGEDHRPSSKVAAILAEWLPAAVRSGVLPLPDVGAPLDNAGDPLRTMGEPLPGAG